MLNDKKELQWEYLGEAGADAGLLMVGDPCYFIGKESNANQSCGGSWSKFLAKYKVEGPEYRLKHQLNYAKGHSGLGVMAGTAHGDGGFPVIGLKEPGGTSDKCHAMMVITGDVDDVPPMVKQAIAQAEAGYEGEVESC